MNQKLKEQIITRFAEDWGKKSPQYDVCVKIFDYLLSRPTNQLKHLTYGSLKNAIGDNPSDTDILTAAQYLCGDRTPVLSLHFEFSDKEDEFIYLEYDEVRWAKSTGKLVHPVTGEDIDNYEDKVFMFFTPSPLISEIRS